jgi:GxxExxY protein
LYADCADLADFADLEKLGGVMRELLYPELSYQVRGALFEVYNSLGPGFREETYKIATCNEILLRGIGVAREVDIKVRYKGVPIDTYRVDIVVDGLIILELKAVEELHPKHQAQLLSYLRASGLQLGLLVNFGGDEIKIRRIANSRPDLNDPRNLTNQRNPRTDPSTDERDRHV